MEAQSAEAAARIAGAAVFSADFIARHPAYFESCVATRVRANATGLTAAMRASAGHDVSDKLANITVPTLVMAGGADNLTPAPAVEAVAQAIPNSQYELFPLAGHMVPVEEPDRFDAVLAEFLDRSSLRRV